MAKKKNTSSEKTFALAVILVLMILIGYYIYQENISSREMPPLPVATQPATELSTTTPKIKELPKITASVQTLLPVSKFDFQIIHHYAYSLAYNENAEQAAWVIYRITADNLNGDVKRKNYFKQDTSVATGSASNADYDKSGYDKGHLAPAADMSWDERAMNESFLLSNMSPQRKGFNRDAWKKLEEQIRIWATKEETLYIVVGPVLHDSLPVIGKNKVAVPEYFFKVVLDVSLPEYKGIGFLMKNEKTKRPLHHFAVTIDSVEIFTGFDLFSALPDELEAAIESADNFEKWIFD